jgi:hypothetical protein
MLSDERLAKIESLVCTHLNEDILPAKVCTLQHDVLIIHSLQGGISAVNARVYAVKVSGSDNYCALKVELSGRPIATGCSMSPVKLTRKTSAT